MEVSILDESEKQIFKKVFQRVEKKKDSLKGLEKVKENLGIEVVG
jgi:hypothetical protein